MALGFVSDAFSYDPSAEGTIDSTDASVSKDISTNLTAFPGFPFGNGFRPLIEQGGDFFLTLLTFPRIRGRHRLPVDLRLSACVGL